MNIAWCFRRALERRAEGDAVLVATVPNIGALSSDCGATFHPLMKDRRNGDSGTEAARPASFSATDRL
ncbi:MAG: hypothetical protein ACR2HX_05260 [Pyrinomonadaceae bacterium]